MVFTPYRSGLGRLACSAVSHAAIGCALALLGRGVAAQPTAAGPAEQLPAATAPPSAAGEPARPARPAAPPCGARRPWVALGFDGFGWPAGLAEDITADLQAGLRLRDIELCVPVSQPLSEPAARVIVHMMVVDRGLVSIDVQDAVTNKRVLRDLDLHRLARDAWGLSLAQAADELLRASWAELTLHGAPPPAQPPPEQIARAVMPPPPPPPERLQALGARFATEYYSGGVILMGADAVVSMWLAPILGASVALGIRAGLAAKAPNGSIESSALTAGAQLFVPVFARTSSYNLTVGLGGHVAELSMTGRGEGSASSRSLNAFIVTLRANVGAYVRLGEVVRLELDVGPGLPVRTASGNQDTTRVVSTQGIELHGSLGLGGMF